MSNQIPPGNGKDGFKGYTSPPVKDARPASALNLDGLSPELVQQIWARRAEQIAQVRTEEEQDEQVEMVLVRLGREIYGLEVEYVHTIRLADQLTRVPLVPDWVAGVVNLRGRILSVIDLERFFGLPYANGGSQPTTRYLVVAETALMELAFLVDEVLAIEPLPANRIQETTNMIRGIRAEYVRGVVERPGQNGNLRDDLLIVLDLPAVLSDPRLVVNQEAL